MALDELSIFMRDRMAELGLSYRAAAAAAGGTPSHGTFNTLVRGAHTGRVSDESVRGIARALKTPVAEVRRLNAQRPPRHASELADLSPRARRALQVIINELAQRR